MKVVKLNKYFKIVTWFDIRVYFRNSRFLKKKQSLFSYTFLLYSAMFFTNNFQNAMQNRQGSSTEITPLLHILCNLNMDEFTVNIIIKTYWNRFLIFRFLDSLFVWKIHTFI